MLVGQKCRRHRPATQYQPPPPFAHAHFKVSRPVSIHNTSHRLTSPSIVAYCRPLVGKAETDPRLFQIFKAHHSTLLRSSSARRQFASSRRIALVPHRASPIYCSPTTHNYLLRRGRLARTDCHHVLRRLILHLLAHLPVRHPRTDAGYAGLVRRLVQLAPAPHSNIHSRSLHRLGTRCSMGHGHSLPLHTRQALCQIRCLYRPLVRWRLYWCRLCAPRHR